MIFTAKHLAWELGLEEGYQLHFNVWEKAGQVVPHIHLHLLSNI
jgi:diadenosine tetraphosphate (Ap4A) HIT family hydrolase